MNVWLKRILVGLFLVAWLLILITPGMAFILAARGQIQLGEQDGRHVRVFLLQEADAEGLAIERAAPVPPPADAIGASCLQTSVSYWFWSGSGGDDSQDVFFCQCLGPDGGALPNVVPDACVSP